MKESVSGYALYSFLNLSTVSYIALICGSTDVLYLSTVYFGIFYLQRITKQLAAQQISYESLREFAIDHKNIIAVFKRVMKLSKTLMLIMYFSNLSMTCFILLVLTTVIVNYWNGVGMTYLRNLHRFPRQRIRPSTLPCSWARCKCRWASTVTSGRSC